MEWERAQWKKICPFRLALKLFLISRAPFFFSSKFYLLILEKGEREKH